MGIETHSLTLLALLLPFLGAVAAPLLCRMLKHNAAWPLAAIPLFIFVHLAGFLGPVGEGRPVAGGYDWIPSLGVRFSWYLDGLSLTFALLISGIGTLIVLYSGGYLKGHPHQGRFLSFMLLFMGAMLGLVVSDIVPHAVRVLGTDFDHLLPADRLRPFAGKPRAAPLCRRWR